MVMVMRHGLLSAPVAPSGGIGLTVPPPTAGVLTGVTRTTYTGSYNINTNGTVISNKNTGSPIGDAFRVNAANVTFSNCYMLCGDYFAIDGDYANCNGLTVDHCTIDGGNIAGNSCVLAAYSNWQVTNCILTGFDNGVMFGGDGGLLEGNYVHSLGAHVWAPSRAYIVNSQLVDSSAFFKCLIAHTSGTGTFAQDRAAHPTYWTATDPHVDGFQTGGCGTTMIRNNWIESYDTSNIALFSNGGAVNGVTITGNTLRNDPLRGDVANTVYALVQGFPVSNVTVTNNRMSPGFSGSYIDRAGATGFTSSGNVDFVTGLPVTL